MAAREATTPKIEPWVRCVAPRVSPPGRDDLVAVVATGTRPAANFTWVVRPGLKFTMQVTARQAGGDLARSTDWLRPCLALAADRRPQTVSEMASLRTELYRLRTTLMTSLAQQSEGEAPAGSRDQPRAHSPAPQLRPMGPGAGETTSASTPSATPGQSSIQRVRDRILARIAAQRE